MNAEAASGEPDAGTLYPVLMQDSNGNQIQITYAQGTGGLGPNTSARIDRIEDVRGTSLGGGLYGSYNFTYTPGPMPHLASIQSAFNYLESYSFAYLSSQPLQSPFNPPVSFGTATLLQTVTRTGLNTSYGFEYGSGAAELTRVTNPAGGILGGRTARTCTRQGRVTGRCRPGPCGRAVRRRKVPGALAWTTSNGAQHDHRNG